jgi:hypothetical protein
MTRLLSHPIPIPLPSAICLSFSVFLCVAGELSLLTGEGEGGVREANLIFKSFNILYGAKKGPPGLVTGI